MTRPVVTDGSLRYKRPHAIREARGGRYVTVCGREILASCAVYCPAGEVACCDCLVVLRAEIRAAAERLNGPRPALPPGLANVVDLAEERARRAKGAA